MSYYLRKLPELLQNLVPQDVQMALSNSFQPPKTNGRKSAIDADNANDLAYHLTHGLFTNREKLLTEKIKGTDMTPIKYAFINNKWNCFILCYFFDPIEWGWLFKSPFDKCPDWVVLIIHLNPNIDLYTSLQNNVDNVFRAIMNQENAIDFFIILEEKIKKRIPDMDLRRSDLLFFQIMESRKTDITRDTEFFHRLTESERKTMLRISNKYKFNFKIDFDNPDYPDLFLKKYTTKALILKYQKKDPNTAFEKFKAFFDSHLEYFNGHSYNVSFIIPSLKEFYEYAYQTMKIQYDWHTLPIVVKHVLFLIEEGFVEQFEFMLSKGLRLNKEILQNVLKKNDPKFIKVISKTVEGQNALKEYAIEKRDLSIIIEYLPDNVYLDSMKKPMAKDKPEMIPEFLEKFSDRLKDSSISSWGLSEADDPLDFMNACMHLKVSPLKYIHDILKFHIREKNRKTALKFFDLAFTLNENFGLDLTDPRYLRFAIENDCCQLAAKLIRLGANPDEVEDWNEDASIEMIRTITSLI